MKAPAIDYPEAVAIGSHIRELVKRGSQKLLPNWQMTAVERVMLLTLLKEIKPDVSIEVGTYKGGSLSAIALHSKKVYSLDIDPECGKFKKHFKNVNFKCGDSTYTIPQALKEIKAQGRHLEFVLIDADHSRESVRRDTNLILQHRPTKPMLIIWHDSFNPYCRMGILEADWAANPYVHSVNLDFVPGTANLAGDKREMWCGFGAALLLPKRRKDKLVIRESARWIFDEIWPRTSHAKLVPPPSKIKDASAPIQQTGFYDFFANKTEPEMLAYLSSSSIPQDKPLSNDSDSFIQIRKKLESKISKWRNKGLRIAIYGAGKHTLAVLGLIPELYPMVTTFIDKNAKGKYLGKPSIKPSKFTPKNADIVLYSSRSSENEMYKSFSHYKVEHVRLYS